MKEKRPPELVEAMDDLLHRWGIYRVLDVLTEQAKDYAADMTSDSHLTEVSSMGHAGWTETAIVLKLARKTVGKFETAEVPF